MRRWSYLVILIGVSVLVLAVLGVAAQKPAWELINWDKPVPAAQRLAADKYILPEGWQQATKGVKSIYYFNSGAMKDDPATAENLKEFEQLTGIHVEYAEVSSLILFDKELSVFVSRDPSVQGMSLTDGPMELSTVIGAGWVVPLPFWTPAVQAEYPKALVDAMRGPDGRIYATCDTMRSYVLFYRPSWLKAAGVDKPPETWQEVRVAAKKCRDWAVKNLGPDYWGIVFPGQYNLSHMIQAGIYSQGARVLVNGKPNFNTPEGKKSWQLWYDFIATDHSAPKACLGYTWHDYQEVFLRGKAAMMLGFTTYIPRSANPELAPALTHDVHGNPVKGGDFSVVPPPKWDTNYPDSDHAAFIDFDGFVLNRYADDKKLAAMMLLAEFRMSKQGTTNEVLVEGNDSFFPGTYNDPRVKAAPFAQVRKIASADAVMEAFPPGSKHAMDLLVEYFARAVTGELGAQEALDKCQAEIDKIYE